MIFNSLHFNSINHWFCCAPAAVIKPELSVCVVITPDTCVSPQQPPCVCVCVCVCVWAVDLVYV